MVTVAIHEIGHGLGFLSFTQQDGSGRGLLGNTLGTPDIYSVYDRYLQRGNGPLRTCQGTVYRPIVPTDIGRFSSKEESILDRRTQITLR